MIFPMIINILILSSSAHLSTANSEITPRPFEKIYAFGDSYRYSDGPGSATGPSSFAYVSNLPYGQTFFHHPTNRYSDGRLVIDFVAELLSLPYLPPYLNATADKSSGVNFAVAGSTAIEHEFFVKNNLTRDITPESLGTQLSWFTEYLESQGCIDTKATPQKCRAVFDEALIRVGEIGANDYGYTVGSSVSDETIQELAIKRATDFLEILLYKGAKYVVVQGLPPTGCLTMAMYFFREDYRDNIGCVESVNKQSYSHNTIYQAKVEVLRKQFPDALIVYADYWNAYSTVIENAHNYGFKELYKVCCGSSGGKYNYDSSGPCGSPVSTHTTPPFQYLLSIKKKSQ
ncbi:GDSL-like Lipase/Acylhydrolase superfamily protein [Heracleum sosnowskyi]|uniref:GDSL-like Lipase/Acylhydrolase superfamily protein n=1 Tax=Heracleum sosnowskyi TaxID=360622 RepID=A0AAD8M309_9APIA|nr:GDSL-like Lipase/Acylhydrolase superfamily protein [Heracleum sosnowskyi]